MNRTVAALIRALATATLAAALLVIWCPVGTRWQWAATTVVLLLATAVVGGGETKRARTAAESVAR